MTRLLLLVPLLALAACSGDERPQTCNERCGGGGCLRGEACETGNCASGVCAASSFCLAP